MNLLTRRLFLKVSGRSLTGVFLGSMLVPRLLRAGNTQSVLNEHEIQTLALLIHDLFPHKDRSDMLYVKAALKLSEQLVEASKEQKLVHEGLNHLDELTGKEYWRDVSGVRRIAILRQIESSPFFGFLRNNAAQIVYRNPDIWNFIGYGGSSIEHGGYLNWGFNDIDWLPKLN